MAVGKHQEKAFEIIQSGKVSDLKKIFEDENLSADIFDENGMTPLMQAAYKGKLEMCEYLISKGADVNTTCHGNSYTALMMAALSGSADVVTLLLESGACTEKTNSIGKTAANLAAFTSQQECLNKIRNYLSSNKFEPYTKPLEGEAVARLPVEVVEDLRGMATTSNPHPVNVLLYIKDHPKLMEEDVLIRAQNVMIDMCQKCHRTPQDFDEVLAIKLHYISCIIKSVREYFAKNKDGKIDKLIKRMLHADGNGFPVRVEAFIRGAMQEFPHVELPSFREFVTTVAKTKIGTDPTALTCLINILNGLRGSSSLHNVCSSCSKNHSPLRCSVCKEAQYCTQRCQKLHWSVHKGFCKKSN